jgi:hypothetical protein
MAHNLLSGPEPVLLPDDGADFRIRELFERGEALHDAVRANPDSSLGWAVLAEEALAGRGEDGGLHDASVIAYAFARTGYHRGLDALRRSGWRGQGPVPVEHEPNQGVLRAILVLGEAADRIGESAEGERCRQLLVDSGTSADEVRALRS